MILFITKKNVKLYLEERKLTYLNVAQET